MASLCIHDLAAAQCADCSPRPEAVTFSQDRGPWFTARFDGDCGGCGAFTFEGDRIRSDGAGGWLGECCGEDGR